MTDNAVRLPSRRSFLGTAAAAVFARKKKKIVFLAGRKSHRFGEHAHYTGSLLMAKILRNSPAAADAVVVRNGWPEDSSVFEGAAAIVLYMDGLDRHPILPHLDELDTLMKRGVGLVALHYAVVVPKGEAGARMLDWIGGYYETDWSVNPMWSARFDALPVHPITRGVKPFATHDEWYYHMRFQENMRGVTPILTAIPPDSTRMRPFGPHSGNPAVRARLGMPEHVAWAYERPNGGRGFALTGAHYHWALEVDSFRNLLLNGIAWTAGIEVPPGGISPVAPTWDELMANQEGTPPEGFSREAARKLILPRQQ